MDTFFDIEPQKRSRVTKLGAQKQHRVIQRFVSPPVPKQSEITCARDKCVVFHTIDQAICWEVGSWKGESPRGMSSAAAASSADEDAKNKDLKRNVLTRRKYCVLRRY